MDESVDLDQLVSDESKETKISNQYNLVPHLTQDTTQESIKNTIKHHRG